MLPGTQALSLPSVILVGRVYIYQLMGERWLQHVQVSCLHSRKGEGLAIRMDEAPKAWAHCGFPVTVGKGHSLGASVLSSWAQNYAFWRPKPARKAQPVFSAAPITVHRPIPDLSCKAEGEVEKQWLTWQDKHGLHETRNGSS